MINTLVTLHKWISIVNPWVQHAVELMKEDSMSRHTLTYKARVLHPRTDMPSYQYTTLPMIIIRTINQYERIFFHVNGLDFAKVYTHRTCTLTTVRVFDIRMQYHTPMWYPCSPLYIYTFKHYAELKDAEQEVERAEAALTHALTQAGLASMAKAAIEKVQNPIQPMT